MRLFDLLQAAGIGKARINPNCREYVKGVLASLDWGQLKELLSKEVQIAYEKDDVLEINLYQKNNEEE